MIAWVRILLLVVIAAFGAADATAQTETLRDFARRVDLRNVDGFVAAVTSLRTSGQLPRNFLTKSQAQSRGWGPGADLCRSTPGGAIGGDRFNNREGLLPAAAKRRWTEADLDYDCGQRGAKRLVWSSDGLYFVTVDHYRTFVPVPK